MIDSTASPYKFSRSVLSAVTGGNLPDADEFEMVNELYKTTGSAVPAPLVSLKDKEVRFDHVCTKEDMGEMVFKLLGI